MKNTLRGRYLPEFVYGSVDGTVTTFAIVTGAMGAGLAPGVVLVLGVANVLADGLSMASGNYLAEQSNRDIGHSDNEKSPIRSAVVTFGSFVAVGMVPLMPFLFDLWFFVKNAFACSIMATVIAFVFIGWSRAKVSGTSKKKSICQTLIVGILAAAVSYGVGHLLRGIAAGV